MLLGSVGIRVWTFSARRGEFRCDGEVVRREERRAAAVARGWQLAKPHRAIFRMACRVLGVHPGQAVHIGDRLDTDAGGPRDAGLHGGWLDRSGAGAFPQGAGISVIGRLAELPALVTGRAR
jgi:phosphoglycolate phosphatase-like HAD superfamily hydrolase